MIYKHKNNHNITLNATTRRERQRQKQRKLYCCNIKYWYWFQGFFLKLQKYSKIKFLTVLPSKFLPVIYISLSYSTVSKKIDLKKSRRNQSTDWQCRVGFFLTETTSQTHVSWVAVSIVIFFQQHFPSCNMYAIHRALLYLLNI